MGTILPPAITLSHAALRSYPASAHATFLYVLIAHSVWCRLGDVYGRKHHINGPQNTGNHEYRLKICLLVANFSMYDEHRFLHNLLELLACT